MSDKIMLTGIKPTGYPHLGNYIGAIKPALQMSKKNEGKALYFIADYHALNAVHDPSQFSSYTKEVAATWLSLGLGEDVIFLSANRSTRDSRISLDISLSNSERAYEPCPCI